jgi:hypothetical protein
MQPEGNVKSDPSDLERIVEQKIHERTFRRVQNLRVELSMAMSWSVEAQGPTMSNCSLLRRLERSSLRPVQYHCSVTFK